MLEQPSLDAVAVAVLEDGADGDGSVAIAARGRLCRGIPGTRQCQGERPRPAPTGACAKASARYAGPPTSRGRRALVTIGMNYTVLPGKEKIFEDACARVVETMKGVEGHDESHLYHRVGGESVYLIVSRWSGEEAFSAFIQSDAFKKVTNWGKQNILTGPPRHTTYREG